MIELRWLEKRPAAQDYKGDYIPPYRVLQYRQIANYAELGLHPPLWSEWKDVPVVHEWGSDS